MKKKASQQIIKFNTLLNLLYKHNKAEIKEAMLSGYNVESTLDLTDEQLAECVAALEKEQATRKVEPSRKTRQLRSKCLGLMTDIGVKTSDWARVNTFVAQPRMLNGRRLYDLTDEELEAFARKLQAVKAEYNRREQDEKHWASSN